VGNLTVPKNLEEKREKVEVKSGSEKQERREASKKSEK